MVFFVSKEELQILGFSFVKHLVLYFLWSLKKKQEGQLGAQERPLGANLVGVFRHQKAPVRSEDPEWKIGMPWLLKATFSSDSKVRLGERADYWEPTSMDHRYMMHIYIYPARYSDNVIKLTI